MFTFINTQKSDSKSSIGMIHDSVTRWLEKKRWMNTPWPNWAPALFFLLLLKNHSCFLAFSSGRTFRGDHAEMSSFSLLSLWGMKRERLVPLMLIRTRFCPLYSPPRHSEGARTNLHFHPPGFERTAQTSLIKPVMLMTAERFSARCGPADWKLDYVKHEAEPVSIR